MRIRSTIVSVVVAASFLPIVTGAHHSRVEYNRGALYEFEGEVVQVLWRSPHFMITVREQTADGRKDWVLEGPGAGTLVHEGLVDGYIEVLSGALRELAPC